MDYLLLLIGFVLLIKGADFFVDGSSSIARLLKIPSIVIGLTLVSMGTSAPEAAVSITAGMNGNNGMSLGNIIGSNIFNLLAVVGCAAIIRPIASPASILKRDLWWNLGTSILLFLFIMNKDLSRLEGLLLCIGLVIYMVIIVRKAMSERIEEVSEKPLPLPTSLFFIAGGLFSIIVGARLVVNSASTIAKSFGMSDALVGLTIVAIGTSLPELITSVVAARKGDSGIALGNIVGSCLFNILFILGLTSMLTPIPVTSELIIDGVILILMSALILIFARTQKITNRCEGIVCLACYVIYTAYIIIR